MRHNVRPFRAFSALRRLLTRHQPSPIAAADELADFLAVQATYVAQRSVLEYCRARTGLNWDKLFQEEPFVQSFEICRWEAYALLLGDVAELALILLRRQRAGDPAALLPGLSAASRAALLRHPVPAHRSSWTEAVDALEQRLARALLAEPHPVHLVGVVSADAVFELLPIHADLRRQDRDMFRNSVRFALCRIYEEMTRRLDVAALERSLQAPDSVG